MGGVTSAALVGTKVPAQCLEKPGTSAPGRSGLGLSTHIPTLTAFPQCHSQRRPSGQEQSPRSLSHLELCVTSCTARKWDLLSTLSAVLLQCVPSAGGVGAPGMQGSPGPAGLTGERGVPSEPGAPEGARVASEQ